jgi:hypothetical protein
MPASPALCECRIGASRLKYAFSAAGCGLLSYTTISCMLASTGAKSSTPRAPDAGTCKSAGSPGEASGGTHRSCSRSLSRRVEARSGLPVGGACERHGQPPSGGGAWAYGVTHCSEHRTLTTIVFGIAEARPPGDRQARIAAGVDGPLWWNCSRRLQRAAVSARSRWKISCFAPRTGPPCRSDMHRLPPLAAKARSAAAGMSLLSPGALLAATGRPSPRMRHRRLQQGVRNGRHA